MAHHFTQAYQQAPWRVQLQSMGVFMLGLVLVSLAAGLYLHISAQTAAAGVKIQELETERDELTRKIAHTETQIGFLTASSVLEQRAQEMGFVKASPENTSYMVVPTYPGRQTAMMAPPPGIDVTYPNWMKASYSQSLWEWMYQVILAVNIGPEGIKP
ncbi:MAG: hypothetical protein GYA17_06945 [Chloroflexi bacterium]|nr:hypothetical protein [Anaerolineaceae bacterium]NMB88078.1 hypothetical protein [Chloroflexota bacterium]